MFKLMNQSAFLLIPALFFVLYSFPVFAEEEPVENNLAENQTEQKTDSQEQNNASGEALNAERETETTQVSQTDEKSSESEEKTVKKSTEIDSGAQNKPASTAAMVDISKAARRGISWDLELEGGVLAYGHPGVRYRGMGRIRGGVLLISEPHYLSLGGAFEGFGQVEAATVYAMYTHLYTGLWAETGLGMTVEKEFTIHVSAGFTLLGVEFQKNFGDGSRDNLALIVKMRIPIGILVFGLLN